MGAGRSSKAANRAMRRPARPPAEARTPDRRRSRCRASIGTEHRNRLPAEPIGLGRLLGLAAGGASGCRPPPRRRSPASTEDAIALPRPAGACQHARLVWSRRRLDRWPRADARRRTGTRASSAAAVIRRARAPSPATSRGRAAHDRALGWPCPATRDRRSPGTWLLDLEAQQGRQRTAGQRGAQLGQPLGVARHGRRPTRGCVASRHRRAKSRQRQVAGRASSHGALSPRLWTCSSSPSRR